MPVMVMTEFCESVHRSLTQDQEILFRNPKAALFLGFIFTFSGLI